MSTPHTTPPPIDLVSVSSSGWSGLLERHRWLPYVLPLAVYLLAGSLGADRPPDREAPTAAQSSAADRPVDTADASGIDPAAGPQTGRSRYPLAYAFQFFATLGAVWLVRPVYRSVGWRVSGEAIVFGLLGGVVWIAVCRGGWESRLWSAIGQDDWAAYAARPAFNPLAAFADSPLELALFLALRFAGLVLLVPLIEEFFLRGFLMRFFMEAQWWTIPWGTVTRGAAAVATAYGVFAHPAEPLAAALWFSLITWLYVRTRHVADCVVAHAVTNGMLGIYVLAWQDWRLW